MTSGYDMRFTSQIALKEKSQILEEIDIVFRRALTHK